ncbi:glycosyltransferase family 4 protein [Undibacterium squillarum]|uniref:Glycosyltransferase involved in cell wall biosynthesis n=1 Tax=Undibacterium squillarum TaxID=1131567 RepID=A0ABQ2XX02_9BURK|nr:glycosyltransferase family 4 protein [Undibacterium squillarum]GGX36510.1 hypothetical protein GCM10010946_12900 [Undibacterium squillarum]
MQNRALVYVLHSGEMFGTERMALATMLAQKDSMPLILVCPPGKISAVAERFHIQTHCFRNNCELLSILALVFSEYSSIAFFSTAVSHSVCACLLALLYRADLQHVHMVHGGTDESRSYGRKKWLNWLPVRFVAVSEYVRSRLLAHGVPGQKITVIHNFLLPGPAPFHHAFTEPVRKAIVVSRLDPIKRIDLLLHALSGNTMLADMPVDICGTGWCEQALRQTAQQQKLNVRFTGFCDDIPARLATADVLIHTCPEEPFGLVVLEAMRARIPVCVPDQGGTAEIVRDGWNGFLYQANNPADLARVLTKIRQLAPAELNRITVNATQTLEQKFSQRAKMPEYIRLIGECK